MLDWTTFLSGGAAGSVLGVVVGGLTGNLSHELLEEWRDHQAERREREKEQRDELRTIREAKRERLLPVLDQVFTATDIVITDVARLLSEGGLEDMVDHERGESLSISTLAQAMETIGDGLLVIRREMEAPALIQTATLLRETYDELDTELRTVYADAHAWQRRGAWMQAMLQEIQEQAEAAQQAVLWTRRALEEPR